MIRFSKLQVSASYSAKNIRKRGQKKCKTPQITHLGSLGIIEMGENQLFQERMGKLVKVRGGQENKVEEC